MHGFLQTILEAVTQHVPIGDTYLPLAAGGVATLFGLVLLLKGARLAPALAAVAFAVVGGLGASFAAPLIHAPAWPAIGIGAVLGLILGLALFRVWLATLVAACFVLVSASVYSARVLQPYLANYTADGLDVANQLVTVPAPNAAVGAAATPSERLGHVWSYLSANVPSFQTSVWAIVISTALAGIVFGWLLPRASRAIWAATAGTFVFGVSLMAMLEAYAPSWHDRLASLGNAGWAVVGAIWLASLIYNLIDVREQKPKKASAPPEAPPAKAKTA